MFQKTILYYNRNQHTAVCRIECSPVLRDFEHATAVGQSNAPLKGHQRSGRSRMGPWRRPETHVPEISRHETAFYSANGCIMRGYRRFGILLVTHTSWVSPLLAWRNILYLPPTYCYLSLSLMQCESGSTSLGVGASMRPRF